VEAALGCLQEVAFTGPVLVSSFNPFSIAAVKQLAPDVETGLLTDVRTDARAGLAFAREEGHAWILPWVEKVVEAGSSFAGDVHGAGMRLGVWLVDEPDAAIALWRSGVDAVATNDPAAIVARRRTVFDA
jgi:glycerophosphoryl diester phosphodiesterase